MFRHRDPEVLVVGAGPVGLVAAVFLQQYGVRVEIVDMHQRTTQHSYALAIHPRTLRLLDEAGLAEGLIGAGRKQTRIAYYDGGEPLHAAGHADVRLREGAHRRDPGTTGEHGFVSAQLLAPARKESRLDVS